MSPFGGKRLVVVCLIIRETAVEESQVESKRDPLVVLEEMLSLCNKSIAWHSTPGKVWPSIHIFGY